MKNSLVNLDNNSYIEAAANSVTEIGDSMTVKMTKRGRSTKLVKGNSSVTKVEMKNCDRFYVTQKKR